MNSDKIDQYLREQIQSLDRVKVPETSWTPQKSWDRIQSRKRKKAVIFWWSGGSAAAAILLLIGLMWFNAGTRLFDESLVEGTSIPQSNTRNQADEPTVTNTSDAMTQPNQYKAVVAKNQVPEEIKPVERTQHIISPEMLKPKIYPEPETSKNFAFNAPDHRILQFAEESPREDEMAFNRVYVFKKCENASLKKLPKQNINDLEIRVDFALNSSSDPPGGLLSGLRK